MDREEMAARIYASSYVTPRHRRDEFAWYVSPKQAFKAADHFLKEAKRQAAKAEEDMPKFLCAHRGGTFTNSTGSYCVDCKMQLSGIQIPEPLKQNPSLWSDATRPKAAPETEWWEPCVCGSTLRYINALSQRTRCATCHLFSVRAGPPKPKREARTFWLYRDMPEASWHACEMQPSGNWDHKIKLREVLE